MKNLICSLIVALAITACNSKSAKTESTSVETTESATTATDTAAVKEPIAQTYSCPMHPEVTGKKDAECPKCGMPLTEPVK